MAAKILITGATGNVGLQLVQELSALGIEIRAAVHSHEKINEISLPHVEVATLDFAQPRRVAAAMQGIEKLFLLTPVSFDQVEIAKGLVDLAKSADVKHIVRLSALGTDHPQPIQFGRWHGAVEQYIRESGIAYTLLRPGSFMENFTNYHAYSIRGESRFYMPHGEGRISYIAAADIAAVAAEVLTQPGHEGKAYNLTGPEALGNTEIAAILSEVLGRTILYVSITDAEARQGMTQAGMPAWGIDAMMELNNLAREGQLAEISPDVEMVLGRRGLTFREWVEENVGAFG